MSIQRDGKATAVTSDNSGAGRTSALACAKTEAQVTVVDVGRVSIRQATPADFASIVYHYGPGESPWDPFGDLARLQSIPLEGLTVAEVQGQYAGFLYWFIGKNPWFDPGIERYAHIVEVQVVERYRGQGIGKRLLAYALGQLNEKTVEAIYIDTTEDNAVARHVYEGVGFRPFSRTIHYRREP